MQQSVFALRNPATKPIQCEVTVSTVELELAK